MIRVGAILVSLLLVAAPAAGDRSALIFIRPDAAGPSVDIGPYAHPNWALWPAPTSDEAFNRALSLATGVDWQGEGGDTSFRSTGEGKPYASTKLESLAARGYFQARHDNVGNTDIFAMESQGHGVNDMALMAALDSQGYAKTLEFKDPLPPDSCVVYGAWGWDDAKDVSNRADRTIVVEYPPRNPGQRWSRVWLRGRWPEGLPTDAGVPGLIPARRLLRLIIQPDEFAWREPNPRWPGADRWLEFVRVTGVETQAALGLASLIALVLGVAAVARERRSKLALAAIGLALMAPSAVLVGGNLAYAWDLGAWWPAFFLALSGEAMAALALTKLGFHRLFSIAAVSLAATMATNPLWSFYSPVLGHVSYGFSPQWFGIAAASLVGVLAFGQSLNRWVLCAIGGGSLGAIWFVSAQQSPACLALVVASIVVGLDLFKGIPLLAAAFLSSNVQHINHWVWTPLGLLREYGQRDGIDVSGHVLFFASFGFVAAALTVALSAAFVDGFFWHETRRAFNARWNRRALFWVAAFAAVQGIANPTMLTAALYIAFAATYALMAEAVWSP